MNKVEDIELMKAGQVKEITVLGCLAVPWEKTSRHGGGGF